MTNDSTGTFLQQLRALFRREEGQTVSDGQLLGQYLNRQDDKAFTELLCRHGPMVLAVSRRVLGNSQDSEDAFQATFLLLVQKGRSIARHSSVASWLYGVAYRCALKARTLAARRRESVLPDEAAAPAGPDQELLWRDLRAVLDQEMDRLPAKYRLPLLLCCLEGKTFQEASQELGWSLGTVATRIARAKELLRGRLVQRGVTLAVSAGAAFLPQEVMAATVPAALTSATQQSAAFLAGGGPGAALNPRITLLLKGTQRAMFFRALRKSLVFLVVLGLAAVGLALALQQTLAGMLQDEAPVAAKKPPSVPRGQDKAAKPPQPQPKPQPLKIVPDLPKEPPTVAQVNEGTFTFPVVLENTSKETMLLWPFLSLRVYDSKGKDVPVSTRLGRFGIVFANSALEIVPFLVLKPGEKHRIDVTIANYIHDPQSITGWQLPEAGEYQLKFAYEYNRAQVKKDLGQGTADLDNPNHPWNRAYEVNQKFDVKLKVVGNPDNP